MAGSPSSIPILAELEAYGQAVTPVDDEWVKILCPFHEDVSPSCSVNLKSGGFKCFGCGARGAFAKLLARIGKVDLHTVDEYLSRKYGIEKTKIIEISVVEAMHQAIWGQKHLLKELYDRGITDEDIRRYRIGFGKDRVAIPVKNEAGLYVNVRYYMPGAAGVDKFKNERSRGKMRLYPVEQLGKYKQYVICGGEMKALVTARVCNPHGIGAICASGGESNWEHGFTLRFKDCEKIWVMLDVDAPGKKAASARAAQMSVVVPWVGVVDLPLDLDKYPHGDVNDFVGRENGDLMRVLQETQQWVRPIAVADPDEEPRRSKFSEIIESRNVGKRMKFSGVIAAASEKSFVVPKRIVVDCTKDFSMCPTCGVFPIEEKVHHVSPESPAILEMVNVPKDKLDDAVRTALGVPRRCDKVSFTVTDYHNVEDVRLNPSLEITNRDNERALQQALCVACPAALNGTYEFVGRMYPHPKSQQATMVLSASEATHDALERHVPRDLHKLRVFKPMDWSVDGIQDRLDMLYDDLEANVTRIYLRRDLHLIIDLAYHSALLMEVDGKQTKAWAEVVIVGDSACGKTETTKNLMEHYRLGEKADCKNMTTAGLLGGLSQIGDTWMVSWGLIPTNDKRLLVMEEMKGLALQTISSLTDMRSSGRAELSKIRRQQTFARTRLVGLSNARDERTMSTYNYGVEAVRDLIGAPEDVRRFDMALIVTSDDIDNAKKDALTLDPPQVKHRFTSELCNALILWAWTRRPDQIKFESGATRAAAEAATAMCAEYSDHIPLIDQGSTRQKIYRLALALACRTFSTGDSDEEVLVRQCHVEYIAKFMRRVYSAPRFGYLSYSEKEKLAAEMLDPKEIKSGLEMVHDVEECRQNLLLTDQFDHQDVMDWFRWDRQQTQDFVSLLVRRRAIRRKETGHKYQKTAAFIEWLKRVELTPRPSYLQAKESF